jgi:hypothetical protein
MVRANLLPEEIFIVTYFKEASDITDQNFGRVWCVVRPM